MADHNSACKSHFAQENRRHGRHTVVNLINNSGHEGALCTGSNDCISTKKQAREQKEREGGEGGSTDGYRHSAVPLTIEMAEGGDQSTASVPSLEAAL